jgi:hypothetical protein
MSPSDWQKCASGGFKQLPPLDIIVAVHFLVLWGLIMRRHFSVMLCLAAIFLALGPISAKADVVWNVSGTFVGGGGFTGTFAINVYGELESNYSFTTTAFGAFPGFTYNSSDSYFSSGTFFVDAQPQYQADLHLEFLNSLSVASADNPLKIIGPSYECQGSFSCYLPDVSQGGDIRFVGSGFAAAVPEASSWALMLVGFFAVGALTQRRRSRRAVRLAR